MYVYIYRESSNMSYLFLEIDSVNDTNLTKQRKTKDYQIKIRDQNFTE